MGLIYQTTRWLDHLWSEHLEMSSPARDLVESGIKKQGEPFAGFPSDLHARLYLPSEPRQLDGPDWATRLHSLASELGEWQRLKGMCSRNGFAAGVATEAMLNSLLPMVPEMPPQPPQDGASGGGGEDDSPDASGSQEAHQGSQRASSDADVRAALRRATRKARDAVQQAEAELEGMSTPLGFSMPCTSSVINNAGPANLKAIRDAHTRIKDSRRLKRITELAGRLERIAATKARSKVKPGVGEIHGINLGDDLSRLLPSELVLLKNSRFRMAMLSRLLQRRALCYGMKGREPQARGSIVVLLDESSSMREHDKDIWSKAVTLALLSTATRQKRAWHLIAFNRVTRREVEVPVGQATAQLIQQALDHRCSGGTDFNKPIMRAIDIIQSSRSMNKADVVIITDGEDSLRADTVEAATSLTKTEGVSWFAVGVGPEADQHLTSLEPIATSMVVVRDTEEHELIVPVINLERAA